MILLIFSYSDGKSPKSSSQPVGIVEVLKQYPLTRDLVHDKILYFYQIQLTLDKNPQNCKNSFCLGPFLTTKSRRYDDYKDSLSEIFFRNYAHKQGHMKCKLTGWPWAKQLAEQSAIHMVENGLWPLTSEQDNKGQMAEMTKRWSPVTNRRYFRRHGCPCKCPRWWGTHSSLPWERWLPCRGLARFIWAVPISWLPIGTLTRLVWATPIGWWLPIRTLTRCSSELHMYSSKSSDKSQVGSRTRNLYTSPQILVHSQAGETSAKIDSQRFTTETRWIIVRSQIRQRLSQRAMLPRKRASEMDCSRVRLCHIINRVQSDKRVRSSQSNFIKVRHMTEKSQHRVPHVVFIIFTRTTT